MQEMDINDININENDNQYENGKIAGGCGKNNPKKINNTIMPLLPQNSTYLTIASNSKKNNIITDTIRSDISFDNDIKENNKYNYNYTSSSDSDSNDNNTIIDKDNKSRGSKQNSFHSSQSLSNIKENSYNILSKRIISLILDYKDIIVYDLDNNNNNTNQQTTNINNANTPTKDKIENFIINKKTQMYEKISEIKHKFKKDNNNNNNNNNNKKLTQIGNNSNTNITDTLPFINNNNSIKLIDTKNNIINTKTNNINKKENEKIIETIESPNTSNTSPNTFKRPKNYVLEHRESIKNFNNVDKFEVGNHSIILDFSNSNEQIY